MVFAGFTPVDFAAYLPKKWASNVYNLERLQVKQKLEALGRSIGPLLKAADGSLLACEVSSEHPTIFNQHRVNSQYLFFSRNEESRRALDAIINRGRSMASLVEDPSPLRSHMFLSLMIDAEQVEVALKLHSDASVDRENLLRKCQDFFRREKLLGLLRELPAGFAIGLAGAPSQLSSADIDDAALQSLLERLPQADTWLRIGCISTREHVVAAGAAFATTITEQLTALLPLLHLVAWRRDNDFVSIVEALRERGAKQKSKGLRKNDRVRVVRGIFAGKTGVVQGIDPKGGVRVLLGTMVLKLEGEDVTPA